LYLFHLFGIHELSELFFPLFPLISSWMHTDPEISVSLVPRTSEKLFFEIRPYFIIFPLFGILKFNEKNSFTCFCYKWCVKFSFGSWGIKLYLFHLFGIYTRVIEIFLSLDPTSFISDAYWFGNILFHLFGEQVKHYSSK
jgi:hypothetical protein